MSIGIYVNNIFLFDECNVNFVLYQLFGWVGYGMVR